MPSEKLARILKAKSPYTSEEIEAMSDIDGWNWVYANTKKNVEKLSQICFTGFNAKEKTILTTIATESKLEVVPSVTKNLAFLCAGENAGRGVGAGHQPGGDLGGECRLSAHR